MNFSGLTGRLSTKVFGWAPKDSFHDEGYLRINNRRLEHLATLGLPIPGKSVLEVGAGIGDHTSFFLDRGCTLCVTEPRDDSREIIARRFPSVDVRPLDLDQPPAEFDGEFDIVYAYGLLYHLQHPAEALRWMAQHCTGFLLLETCVSFGDDFEENLVPEDVRIHSQALSGIGCRPTRPWLARELAKHFKYVYFTRTQPWHEQFPTDWSKPDDRPLTRSIFVASHTSIDSPLLTTEMPAQQPNG